MKVEVVGLRADENRQRAAGVRTQPRVNGPAGKGPEDRFSRWYVDRLLDATALDKKARVAFMAVQQLVEPAES